MPLDGTRIMAIAVFRISKEGARGMMEEAGATATERFAAVVAALRDEPGVSYVGDQPHRKSFGLTELRVRDKIFCMLTRDRLVVKLPRARVDALIAAGNGERFTLGQARVMKEWLVVIPQDTALWLELAREALTYVAEIAPR